MLYRISKNGFFLACENRECSHTQPVDEQGKADAPPGVRAQVPQLRARDDQAPRALRRVPRLLGLLGKNEKGEPSCSTIINLDKEGNPLPPKPPPIKTTVKCEKCGSDMLLRDSKRGPFLGCSSFPKCRSTR
jgi:DNA topoisomerase-1